MSFQNCNWPQSNNRDILYDEKLIKKPESKISYENVELGFAIFELPSTDMEIQYDEFSEGEEEMAQQAISSLSKQKRTQRMKNLML